MSYSQQVAALVASLCIFSALSISLGSQYVPVWVTWSAIQEMDASNTLHLLVHHVRIPRTFLASVVGAALAVAGLLMQSLTRNPLADPGILGVNAGATLCVVIAIAYLQITDLFVLTLWGIFGAGLSSIAVYLLALRGVVVIDPVRLVLAGAALSAVMFSITQIITLNSELQVFDQYRHWVVGSLAGRGTAVLWMALVFLVIGLLLAMYISRALNILLLGQALSQSMGTRLKQTLILATLAIVVLAGSATAAIGPVTFVGLCAPHLARACVGVDIQRLLPICALIGANLTLAADSLGRLIGYPTEINIGTMLALIGGPAFIYLVRSHKVIKL